MVGGDKIKLPLWRFGRGGSGWKGEGERWGIKRLVTRSRPSYPERFCLGKRSMRHARKSKATRTSSGTFAKPRPGARKMLKTMANPHSTIRRINMNGVMLTHISINILTRGDVASIPRKYLHTFTTGRPEWQFWPPLKVYVAN